MPIVLIVDDMESDRLLIRLWLEKLSQPVETIELTDGRDFVAWMENPQNPVPDLVILDLKMQRMSGAEALAKLSGNTRLAKTKVVVRTESDQQSDKDSVYQAGPEHLIYAQKRPTSRDIIEIMSDALSIPLRTQL